MIVRLILTLALSLCAVLSGCRKAEIATYRIPKEKDAELPPAAATAINAPAEAAPMATNGGDMARTAVPTAEGAALTWTAPKHWKAKPGSAMRKGSYTVPGNGGGDGDMSITAFPNDVGGELANVNRWRGQLQLPPITDSDLAQAVARHDHQGLKFGEVDLIGTGPHPQRILGAWVAFGGATWFFKLTGPDSVVAGEKAAFAAFLDSVRPAEGAAHSAP